MTTILPQMLFAWVDTIGWTLLHFLWQGTALGVIYYLVRPFCRGMTARYRLGMGMLMAMLACPIVTVAYLAPDAASTAAAALALPDFVVSAQTAPAASSPGFEALMPWLVAAWFLGASIIGLRAFAHWRRLAWLVRNAAIPLADCSDVLIKLCRRFGVARPIRLLGSLAVDTPMLIGWLRPVILLPISMLSGFTPQQIELIIAHELGHVRRWDYLANLLQVVIETVLFYHPAVHWISRDVRDARESCCDDLVLALSDGSPVVYASALAELEQLRHDGGLAAPALAASGGVLLERIRRIVGAQSVLYDPLPRSGGWPIMLLAAAFMLALLRFHVPAAPTLPLLHAGADRAVRDGSTVAALALSPGVAATVDAAAPAAAQPERSTAPARDAVPPQATVEREAPLVPLGRPKITVASIVPPAMPRVSNIRARLELLPVLAAPSAPEPAVEVSPQAPPVALSRVQPEYPLAEKIRGVTGKVELQFGIDGDGRVHDVSVLESTPGHAFDRVAITALKQWRFAAAGDPARRYTQSFAFALGAHAPAAEPCHEVTGSHICRHVAADEEPAP
jgi:bla regulator protein blaR1